MRTREALLSLTAAALLSVPLLRLSAQVIDGMGIDRPYDFVHVPDEKGLALLGPSLQLSVANLYWLSAVQYIGDRRAAQRGYDKLLPVVDLVTDLDPRHGYAYQTAGIFLSSVQDVDGSDRIFEKGIRRGPRWWSYPYYLAFNATFHRHDHEAAARWAEVAARTPGAPPLAAAMATSMKLKGGSPDDAVRMLEDLRGTARDERTAEALETQYRLAVLQRDLARLNEAVSRFREARGRAPSPLEELVWAGLLPAIPGEPSGGRYHLDPTDGRVHSSGQYARPEPARPPAGPVHEGDR